MTPPERPERPDRPAGPGPSRPERGHATFDRPSGTVVTPDALQVRSRPVLPPGNGGGGVGGPLGPLGRRVEAGTRAVLARDWAVLGLLLVLAALLRFTGLESRGRFDGDQGHDALVLLRLVRDGTLPLLGPPTSIGDFHHGAAYYYLLAPAAWLSGANPTAIVAWIAAIGVAAVAATWWFARMVGGPVTAAIAGLLLAVSPAAIEESTFIWNPNPIPLFAALALGCAWRAHASGAARWWVAAVLSSGMVLQLHVLGIVFMPPIVALAVVDAIRAARAGDHARVWGIVRAATAGLGLAALLFVPLLVHELGSGWEETRHVLDYVAGGGSESTTDLDPIAQVLITLFRVVGWPLVGLVTDAPAAAIVAVSITVVLGTWLAIVGRGMDRTVARWLGLTVVWSGLALTIVAPSLQTVVAGLPNDHYHAYLDPVVIVLLALAARALAVGSGTSRRVDAAARSVIAVALGALVLLDLRLSPPADPNGGWPAARAAGERILEFAPSPVDVRQLPIFKTAEGVGFPVIVAGGRAYIATDRESALRPIVPDAFVVVACDRLFEEVMGAACGGPAELEYMRRLTDGNDGAGPVTRFPIRFPMSPRIVISIYKL
jgi:4-amino-4-deoxy-L-arabinose transferase-like glycosyltransferase